MTDKEKIRADVDAAMQEVEEKSKAFTEAHKGESAEEILAGMKGIDPSIQDIIDKHWFEMLGEEPILEVLAKYLDHVSKEEAMKTKDAIDRWFAEYFPEPVSKPLVDIEIPFGKDSELIEESIAVPEGCHAIIEGNEVVIRKGEESVSEDLEEAAKRYATEGDEISGLCIIDEEVYAFKAGAKWQKQRMIKDAVECKIGVSYENPYGGFTQLVDSKTSLVTFGKEVKLIIIKED